MMKKTLKYIAFLLTGITLAVAGSVSAGMISVPSSSGFGQILVGLTTGNYQASSSPTIAGTVTARNFVATSTASSTFPVFYSATGTVNYLNGKSIELDDDGYVKIYNTSDKTTNFQYGRMGFDGSIFSIGSNSGGSAQEVTMIVGTSSRPHLKLQPAGQPFLRWDNPNGTNDTTQPLIAFADTGGMSASASIQKYMSLHPILDQTGTASYCVLCIEPYEQTLGSGEQYLILAGTSSAQDLFHVTSIGDLYTPFFSVFNNAKEYKATLMTVRAPLQNPQEATMTTLLDYGSNNKQWIDWTLEDYGTDNQGSINIVRSGTKPLLPFVIRFWDSNLGPVSQYGTTNFVTVPAGNSGFGMGSSTLRTDAMVQIASSTMPYSLAIHGESGRETFTVASSGETKSDNFTASSSSKTSSFYNILAGNNRNIFSVVGNFVGVGTGTPQTTLDIRGPNISTTATTLGNLNLMATNTQASDIGSSITFGGFNDNSASVQRVFASIEGKKENGTSGSSLGYLKFRVNNAGTLTDVARFSSRGNFGIGTTSPYAKLSVVGETVASFFTATTTGYANRSTLQDFMFTNATGTQATSTNFFSTYVVGTNGTITNLIATNSTTTNATSTTGYFSGTLSGLQSGFTGRISPIKRLSYVTATSTAWTATTSGAYLPPIISPFAGTIQTAQCSTDAGTLNVDVYHTTTHLTLFNASTTVGTITFSSNNTVTNGEKIYVSAGTPASTPTVLSCTLSITESL